MKKHAIIPIFIPHYGCGHSCVFCNQNMITARDKVPTADDVRNTVEQWLSTLSPRNLDVVEIAFFGGSFTGIPISDQSMYLEVAREYKDKGMVDKIHLSTRPDYIDREILDNLRRYSVDTIELGVQSFDNEVLIASKRGHTEEDVYRACSLIKEYGFELGIQLMIGLPGDSKEKAVVSARKAADIGPSLARLYPTVVLPHTQLAEMMKAGTYKPLSEEEAIDITKEMYKVLMAAGVNIMRVGLKSTDLITEDSDLAGSYHPAFRQLVEGEICKEQMMTLLQNLCSYNSSDHVIKTNEFASSKSNMTFVSNEKWFPPMIGHKGCNKKFFAESFSEIRFKYEVDPALPDGTISIVL